MFPALCLSIWSLLMKKLKLVSAGWETYTGWLNAVEFSEGISVNPVPQNIADRISGTMRVVEIEDDGTELGQAGAAARLKDGATIRAEVVQPLARATEEELKEEAERDAAAAAEKARLAEVKKSYTKEELEEIADKDGIKGLREVGDTLGVRGRAIPELIDDILTAQEKLKVSEAGERLVSSAEEPETVSDEAAAAAKLMSPEPVETPKPKRKTKAKKEPVETPGPAADTDAPADEAAPVDETPAEDGEDAA